MEIEHTVQAPIVTQLKCSPRPLPVRVAAMSQILVRSVRFSSLLSEIYFLLNLTCDDLKTPEHQTLN
jgi:hypothetical protein